MRAIVADNNKSVQLVELPKPLPAPHEVIVKVAFAGVNRADLLQVAGKYPPPAGETEVLGIEISGTISAVGADVSGWELGLPVCAVIPGGGYAEFVAVPADLLLPATNLDLSTAAALPEAALTLCANISQPQNARRILLHGGSGGVGTIGIQLLRQWGWEVFATAGSAARAARCVDLGATEAWNYHDNWYDPIIAAGGVDLILDVNGAEFLSANVAALRPDGHLQIIALQGGRHGEIDLAEILRKRLSLGGTTLRHQPLARRTELTTLAAQIVWPYLRQIRPQVHRIYPLEAAAQAHAELSSGAVFGKLLLQVSAT